MSRAQSVELGYGNGADFDLPFEAGAGADFGEVELGRRAGTPRSSHGGSQRYSQGHITMPWNVPADFNFEETELDSLTGGQHHRRRRSSVGGRLSFRSESPQRSIEVTIGPDCNELI